jgi:hypothetical protein
MIDILNYEEQFSVHLAVVNEDCAFLNIKMLAVSSEDRSCLICILHVFALYAHCAISKGLYFAYVQYVLRNIFI